MVDSPTGVWNYDGLFPFKPPETKFGTVRPVTTLNYQPAGLRLTDGNIESFLALGDGPDRAEKQSSFARRLLTDNLTADRRRILQQRMSATFVGSLAACFV